VRDDGALRPDGQPGGDDILERRRWVVAEAIQPTLRPLEAPTGRMMGERAPAHAVSRGPRRGKVAGLSAGQDIKPISVPVTTAAIKEASGSSRGAMRYTNSVCGG